MAAVKPPSRVEKVTFPVLGLAWWSDPSDGRSVSAYCGGGGKSRTGIPNLITIEDGRNSEEKVHISTGDEAGEICKIGHDPVSGRLWLFVSFGTNIKRYRLPSGELDGILALPAGGDRATALAVNAASTLLAVGMESGAVRVYHMGKQQQHEDDNDDFASATCIEILERHTMAVSGLDFSTRGGRLITGSKDGTACVYERGIIVTKFECSIDDPAGGVAEQQTRSSGKKKNLPGNKKASPRALVRSCLFLDLDGCVAITVVSGVRGKSFLSRWEEEPTTPHRGSDGGGERKGFLCAERSVVAPHPISAISLSLDGQWLAWGTASGAVTLWSVHDWKKLREWPTVHDFSVTAIAARPYPGVPVQGEEDGLEIHVRTVSADLSVGYLTMMRRIPRPAKAYGQQPSWSLFSVMSSVQHALKLAIVAWILSHVVKEAHVKCRLKPDVRSAVRCFLDDVVVAPPDRPGITSPPY
jgi:WD40 repeat protein